MNTLLSVCRSQDISWWVNYLIWKLEQLFTWPDQKKIATNYSMFSRFLLPKIYRNYVYNYDLTSPHLLSRSMSDQSFFVIACVRLSFRVSGTTHPPPSPISHLQALYPSRKRTLVIWSKPIRSKIYTHLKSHLIPFQKMFGKTAVLKVSENFQQRDLTSVLFEHLELPNLPPTYLKNWFQHKCFLWVFRQFLRLLKSLFTKVANRRKFCPKKIFGKLPGRPARVLKKNSAMDVLMGHLTPKNASDWMNRKSQRNE